MGNRGVGGLLKKASPSPLPASASGELETVPGARAEAGEADRIAPIQRQAIESQRGGGQPLDEDTRSHFAEAFGERLDDVRVHVDTESARLARGLGAVAFTTERDIFFAEGQYRPGTGRGHDLLTHELAHVLQQRSGPASGDVDVLRPPADALEQAADRAVDAVRSGHSAPDQPSGSHGWIQRTTDEQLAFWTEMLRPAFLQVPDRDLIAEAIGSSSLRHAVAIRDYGVASYDEKLELIEIILNDPAGMVFFDGGQALLRLWESFEDLTQAAAENIELWHKSVDWNSGLEDLPAVLDLKTKFKWDVKLTAIHYLMMNMALVLGEMATLRMDEASTFSDRSDSIGEIVQVATQVIRAQEAERLLRTVRVRGYDLVQVPGSDQYVEVPGPPFDPERPPLSPEEYYKGYDLPAEMPPWGVVSELYDQVIAIIAGFANRYPVIYALLDQGRLEELAFASDQLEAEILVGDVLEKLLENITRSLDAIVSDELNYLDLGPIVDGLLDGSKPAFSGTPWHTIFFAEIPHYLMEDHVRAEFWKALGLNSLAAAAFIVAALATAGSATFFLASGVGVGASVAQAERSWAKYDEALALARAAKSHVRDDLVIAVYRGEASSGYVGAILDTVFVFVNLLTLGGGGAAKAGGGVASAEARAATRELVEAEVAATGRELVETGGAAAGREAGGTAMEGAERSATASPPAAGKTRQPLHGAGAYTLGKGKASRAAGAAAQPLPVSSEARTGRLSIEETRELFSKSLGRRSPISEMNVELLDDVKTFEVAYRNAGGVGPLPPAFVDPFDGRIWVNTATEDFLMLFHEAVHQYAIKGGSRAAFLARCGAFLEEGITEGLTRNTLGPQLARHAYDRHVRFIEMLEERLGISTATIEGAYLDGHLTAFESALDTALGDRTLTDRFLAALRNIGGDMADTVALKDATYIMIVRQAPP